jgi:uracil-DNA glycosylase
LVVGEAPGFNEDRDGEPFIGKAGQMLDRMVENVLGLSRAQIYITNVVKCRPPDNRNPEPDEVARCRPFLLAQLRAIQPDLVLILGSVAARAVLGTRHGITRLRGSWTQVEWEGGRAAAMPTFHPAFLLRQPSEKRRAFEDLKAVRKALDGLPPR